MTAKIIKALATALTVSLAGVAFVASYEGKAEYHSYADAGYGWKLPTICYGHTRGVKRGDVATEAQCLEYLRQDLEVAERGVKQCVKVPISQNQYDMLVSFQFNTGALCVSELARKLNKGQCKEAAKEYNFAQRKDKDGKPLFYNGTPVMKFTTSNGKPLRGLVRRRTDERAIFEKDC